jgi:predicted small secreted protein
MFLKRIDLGDLGMKYGIAPIVALILAALTLTACGPGEPGFGKAPKTTKSESK